MKYQSRELLVTAKVAQHWQEDFEKQVDGLMDIVGKVDTEANVLHATELMDVYHPATGEVPPKKGKKQKHSSDDKPFAFVVFKN